MSPPKKPHPGIKTLDFFGAKLKDRGSNYVGDCVLCGKEGHLYASPETGQWDCKVCGAKGNQHSLLEQLYASWSEGEATDEEWATLERSRGGIPRSVFQDVGVVRHGGAWHVPCRDLNGKVKDLRRYQLRKLFSTAGCEVQLWGAERLKGAKRGTTVWLCEGEWDGMAMRWLLQCLGLDEREIVVAVPGANSMKPLWVDLMRGMKVRAMYDHDDAGHAGAAKAAEVLRNVAQEVKYVHWPIAEEAGYDLRDFITQKMPTVKPTAIMSRLVGLLRDAPPSDRRVVEEEEEVVQPIAFSELLAAFERRAKMTDDLRAALRICAAVALSSQLPGDPLWLYLVGAPGSGKTLLLGAMADSDQCVMRSTVTAHCLISGWRAEGGTDPSLLPLLSGKTFVCKDFTEILTLPKPVQDEVFSTLRGAYDGTAMKQFGNGVIREYSDCRFAMLAGVTHAIAGQKQASMGERFIKYTLKAHTARQADEILTAAIASVGTEVDQDVELKSAFKAFLAKVPKQLPRLRDEHVERLKGLVQLIALMRAQVERTDYGGELVYRPEPESGTRLVKQLAKLAKCLAAVEDKEEVDDDVYSLVERVAMDTANGFHFEIVDALVKADRPMDRAEISWLAATPTASIVRYMDDLLLLKIVTTSTAKAQAGVGRSVVSYHLNPRIQELWKQAHGTKKTRRLRLSRRS